MTTSKGWWWFGWTACMATTGVLTAVLRGYADPLIPPGEWHGLLSKIFIVIAWPPLAWFAMFCTVGLRKPR